MAIPLAHLKHKCSLRQYATFEFEIFATIINLAFSFGLIVKSCVIFLPIASKAVIINDRLFFA